ncbi:hypothetical protein V7200_03520 [Cytobacillus firmus]|uniref:Uncharacterized protein n=1 Tax=Cytobacillus firmus TaxID=1399 RepID=A0A800N985_CYTFI|nr:hypothetical protein [Cytobacillus firmus]KAF0822503.1 hypothetical protein KIS1582_3720 [Cytobacillus firmus]
MLNLQITNINIRYAEGQLESVQVHFNGHDEKRTVNVNGYIPFTAEEYAGNESVTALTGLVRTHIADRLLQTSEAV